MPCLPLTLPGTVRIHALPVSIPAHPGPPWPVSSCPHPPGHSAACQGDPDPSEGRELWERWREGKRVFVCLCVCVYPCVYPCVCLSVCPRRALPCLSPCPTALPRSSGASQGTPGSLSPPSHILRVVTGVSRGHGVTGKEHLGGSRVPPGRWAHIWYLFCVPTGGWWRSGRCCGRAAARHGGTRCTSG